MAAAAASLFRAAPAPTRHLLLSTMSIIPRARGASECCFQLRAALAVVVAESSASASSANHNDCHCRRRSLSTVAAAASSTNSNSFSSKYSNSSSINSNSLPRHRHPRSFHRDFGLNENSTVVNNANENNKNITNATTTATTASSLFAPPEEDGPPRTSVLMELTDRVGALHDVLRFL